MRETHGSSNGHETDKIRYAVVGLGWFAQAAILPAFDHATENSELAALVSSDETKLHELGERYHVRHRVTYQGYQDLLESGEIDAVYLALPNHLHKDYAVQAAEAGIDVLCEKPMAVTAEECEEMIRVAQDNETKLMVAYRLHFEEANLKAIDLVHSGKLGEPRLFSSVFSSEVTNEDDIRLNPVEKGGGTVYDLGVYCINAARYLFRDEPIEAVAFTESRKGDPRFADADEITAAVLRFPGHRIATFATSFGASDLDSYRVLGTEGHLTVQPAYEFKTALRHHLEVGDEVHDEEFPERDQIAPEILYFSDCILNDREPEPNGYEGLADVRIVEALYRSAREGKAVRLEPLTKEERPDLSMEIRRPAPGHQELVHAEGP